MQQQAIRVTNFDSRLLQSLVEDAPSAAPRDAGSLDLLDRHLGDAEVVPADRIGPRIVTMNSEVEVRDIDTQETAVFRVVFPDAAQLGEGRISVLAPLGMAVLGRRVGAHITFQTPGGARRLRVERILYQPEREGIDIG